MIGTVLAALQYAPAVLEFGQKVFEQVTGKPEPRLDGDGPDALAARIESLPEDQRLQITTEIMGFRQRIQELDTERFVALTDGDAEKVRATARPEIARRCMRVLEVYSYSLALLFVVALIDWLARVVAAVFGGTVEIPSITSMVAQLEPAANMIWPIAISGIGARVAVIRKYMGCRERDKAQEFELKASRPLQSSQAVVDAASGFIGTALNAIRSR